MSKKVCFLLAFGPELYSVGQCVHRLPMTPDEGPTKVDVLEIVLF